jgi:hypothetical protein
MSADDKALALAPAALANHLYEASSTPEARALCAEIEAAAPRLNIERGCTLQLIFDDSNTSECRDIYPAYSDHKACVVNDNTLSFASADHQRVVVGYRIDLWPVESFEITHLASYITIKPGDILNIPPGAVKPPLTRKDLARLLHI